MSKPAIRIPAARSWRDIPQPMRPRAMSLGGRWRRFRALLGMTTGLACLGGLAWGGWILSGALQVAPRRMPEVAKAVPILPPELTTDGVLDEAWLARTLALPNEISLIELDLDRLQQRLLGDRQVRAATLTRHFPDRLEVGIAERSPVVRVMAEWRGNRRMLLVARDGVVFAGTGFEPAMLEGLPWLDGVGLMRHGEAFAPVSGMEAVANLLARARFEADHLYRDWRVVSLAHLESDDELEIRTARGITVAFGAGGDFLGQLAKLDFIWEKLTAVTATPLRVDLTLGREVPVSAGPAPAPVSLFPLFTNRNYRELP